MSTGLTCVWVRSLARDLYVGLEEPLEGDVGGKALNTVVGDAVLGAALRTLDLGKGGGTSSYGCGSGALIVGSGDTDTGEASCRGLV